jgi:hypothetical protein
VYNAGDDIASQACDELANAMLEALAAKSRGGKAGGRGTKAGGGVGAVDPAVAAAVHKVGGARHSALLVPASPSRVVPAHRAPTG